MLIAQAASPALRGQVRSYYGFREETPAPVRRREGPEASIVLVVSWEHDWLLGDTRHEDRPLERRRSFVAGLHRAAAITEHEGRSEGMQVSLAPTTAHSLFGLPMHELADRCVPLEDVLEAPFLVERLACAPSWQQRFAILEDVLQRRLAEASPCSPEVSSAWRRIVASGGRLRVGTLCEELGWSRKRLAQRFREEVGLPPKTVARLARFERAVELLERDDVTWPRLAVECGYYDQSHLINDFRELTGVTPPQYAALLEAA